MKRYNAVQCEGHGIDYWISLEEDKNGELVKSRPISEIKTNVTEIGDRTL